MIRSLLGLLAGFAVIIVLVKMANSVVFHGGSLEGPPEIPLQIILLGMSALAAIAGGYVAGAVGRRKPLAHGAILGVLVAGIGGALLLGGHTDIGPSNEPRWFTASMLAVGLVGAALGGLVRGQVALPASSSD